MTNINALIKQFVDSKGDSLEERKAAYELACMVCEVYEENIALKLQIDWLEGKSNKLRKPGFQAAITEESRMDG